MASSICVFGQSAFHQWVRGWLRTVTDKIEVLAARERPSKKLNNICNTLRKRRRIARRAAKSHQETNVTSNAVADCAKARQVDEKTLLEEGREGIVEVGSLCESPEFLSDFGSFRRKAEEIWKNPESPFYTIREV